MKKFHANAGDNLDVGKPFFDIDEDAKKPEGTASSASETKVEKK